MKKPVLAIKAFTLLETLLSLSVMSFIILGLSVPVTKSYQKVEEHLFFSHFEHLYRHQQKLAILQQKQRVLDISSTKIVTEGNSLTVPKSITVNHPYPLVIDQVGGNHSLAKIIFDMTDRCFKYQFYLGSGNYQKTSQSLHSP